MKIRDHNTLLSNILFRRSLSEMTFFVTEKCNMNCPHCFNSAKNRDEKREELSVSEIEKISFPSRFMTRIILSGGEPFLRKDLFDVCRALTSHIRLSHLTIPTNGSMPDKISNDVESFAGMFPGTTIEIKLSLDQTGEKRDLFTKYPGGAEKLVATSRRLRELKKKYTNIRVGAITTVTSENQYDIDKIFDFAEKILRVDEYSLSLARGFEGYNPEFDLKHIIQYYRKIYESPEKKRDMTLFEKSVQKMILYRNYLDIRFRYNDMRYIKCYSGKVRIVMDPYGNIYPCELKGYPFFDAGQSEYFMGNIRDFEYSFKKLLNDKKAFQIREHIIQSKCICNHACDMNMNIIYNLKELINVFFFSGEKMGRYLYDKDRKK